MLSLEKDMNLCLSSEQIERYLLGSCCEDEQKAIETHITECENCRQQIESVRLTKGASSQSDLDQTRDITIDCNTEEKPSSYVNEDKYGTKTIGSTSSISQTPPVAGSADGAGPQRQPHVCGTPGSGLVHGRGAPAADPLEGIQPQYRLYRRLTG